MSEVYRQRSPETWAAARDAYLDGATAEEACERFHLGLSAFRKRARVEGWRRADQDAPEAEPIFADDDLPDLDDDALSALAFRGMGLEARRGNVSRALAWARLRDMTLRQMALRARLQRRMDRQPQGARLVEPSAEESPGTDAPPSAPPKPAPGLAKRALAAARALHEVHEVHPVRPFSRAERRRLAAQTRKTGPPAG